MDVDAMIDPALGQLADFVQRLDAAGLYVSASAAHEALADSTMFNAIDPETSLKADLMVCKHRSFNAHDGDITVRSTLAIGTTFDLYFPASRGDGRQDPLQRCPRRACPADLDRSAGARRVPGHSRNGTIRIRARVTTVTRIRVAPPSDSLTASIKRIPLRIALI